MMTRRCFVLALFVLMGASLPARAETADERLAKLINEIDDMWRGRSSEGKIKMQVKTKHYTRTMTMKAWSKGKEKSLVRILTPLKEKGTSTLKSGESIYSYLPKTDRTIRLTSGMMMGSWMGSHFTNDDLVKESRLLDDYDSKISFEGAREGKEVIEITMMPKPDAAVVWGKIVMSVEKKTRLPLKQVYFDEDMAVARTMTFSGVKKFGDRELPAVLRVVPADKPDEFTEVIYLDMKFNIDLSDSFFSKARLRKR